MPTKKKKAVRRSSRRRARGGRFFIVLAGNKRTIYVARELAALSDTALWRRLAAVRGKAANVATKTLVAFNRNDQIKLLGGNLNPKGGVIPNPHPGK